MSDAALLYETRGPVAWLTLNRPKAMNALNLDLIGQFGKYLSAIANDETIRVLVITGNGSAFCAGVDLKALLAAGDLPAGEPDFLDRVTDEIFSVLFDFPKPVIAALNGVTMAGGLELAMCADLVVAAETAKIADAHANYGVFPGAGGAALLPRLIPHNVAKYLLFSGKTLSAQEMHHYGFVNEVVPPEALIDSAQQLAEQIAQKNPIALRRMKEVANTSQDRSRAASLEHEQAMFRRQMRSYDMAEGLKAFSEKRQPEIQGR